MTNLEGITNGDVDREHYTPNVAINNPAHRKIVNAMLWTVGIILGTAIAVDGASDKMDITAITIPASAGFAFLSSAFGFVVNMPNIPKR